MFRRMNEGESSRGDFMHRRWSEEEISAIVESIVELRMERGNNWRSFKDGDMVRLENQVKTKLPSSNVTQQQMVGKIRNLKLEYYLVVDILTHDAGQFMWDNVNKCLVGDDEVWKEYIGKTQIATKVRGRRLDHFEMLCEVWGFVGDDIDIRD